MRVTLSKTPDPLEFPAQLESGGSWAGAPAVYDSTYADMPAVPSNDGTGGAHAGPAYYVEGAE